MEEIIKFLEHFFSVESIAHTEYRKIDNVENYLNSLKELNLLTINDKVDSEIGFGLSSMFKQHSKVFLDNMDLLPQICKRHLYKISEYNHPTYGKVWACYVSVANPVTVKVKSISSCLFISKIDDNLKIVALFNIDRNTNKWALRGGVENIEYYKLGKPVAIERLMSPENDEWSVEEYSKDR
ncbi:hypothetical protein ACLI1A_07025 [Flavobacterium sp. RHBU_3]|uniref:hypothetical protein n=1 Tax=Flavobacterium sp. RHBU_3 TaxID=3391184 RepID=UPI00398566FA